jgi:transposase
MIIAPGFVGIDISKAHLDLFDGSVGRPERVANTLSAIADLVARWHSTGAFVLFEATGRHDRPLRLALAEANIVHARVNPARARAFARATGVLAKTDAIDAHMLCAMAATLRPAPAPQPSPARETLAELNRRRDQLVATRKQERARRDEVANPLVGADLDAHLAWLDDHIAAIGTAIAEHLAADPDLAGQERLLRSVPGIGPVTSPTLLALMPELGQRSPKAIAALAGLAPLNRDSGAFRGKRAIAGGRPRLRQALYMAAVATIRSRSRFARLYKAMTAAGKPAKVALIAIARKILVTANAVLRDQRSFQPR